MKRICLLFFMAIFFTLNGQNSASVKDVIAKGNSVFIEINDINKNTPGALDVFKSYLDSDMWGKWNVVNSKEEADFVCRLNIEKKGMNVMSATSMGARVRVITEILTKDGVSVWKSKKQQGNATIYTGMDALADAMRKAIKRSIKVELYKEK